MDVIGIWPKEKNYYNEHKLHHYTAALMALSVVCWITVPETYALNKVISDLTLVTDNVATNFAIFISGLKLFLLWKSKVSNKITSFVKLNKVTNSL